jgi:hypothetical protein
VIPYRVVPSRALREMAVPVVRTVFFLPFRKTVIFPEAVPPHSPGRSRLSRWIENAVRPVYTSLGGRTSFTGPGA